MERTPRKSVLWTIGGLASVLAIGCAQIPTGGGGGGGGGGNQSFPVEIELDDNTAEFQVTANEPTEKTILINFDNLMTPPGTEVAGGSFLLEPSDITFEAAGTGKFGVAAQATDFSVEVTGFAFPRDPQGECGDGDEYGVYTVDIQGSMAVAVDPAEITLMPDTVQLIRDNNLAICLRVTSPVDGIVRIAGLDFTIMAGVSEVGGDVDTGG